MREEHREECRKILERKKAEEKQEDREGECLLESVLGVSSKGLSLASFGQKWTKALNKNHSNVAI